MKRKKEKSVSKRPAELCVKNSSCQQTNTLSQLTEEEGNKEKRRYWEETIREFIYDFRIKKQAQDMSWVICESLFNDSGIIFDNYLHILTQETKQR